MLALARQAQQPAYAFYSHFAVGTCILTENENFYLGCNVENSSYPVTQCAESVAIGNMIVHGDRVIKAVLIISPNAQLVLLVGAAVNN